LSAGIDAVHAGQSGYQATAEPVMVTTAGGGHPTVSPDGIWVAYSNGVGIYRIPAGGGEAQLVVGSGREPNWSRTSNLIVYRNDTGVHTVDAFTQATTTLVPDLNMEGGVWSPLGDEIAFQRDGNAIAFLSWPGAQLTIMTCADPDGSDCASEGPTWAPDGLWLAFEDGTDVLEVARTGGTAVNVYQYVDGLDITQPAWSPDGRWIALARKLSPGSEYANIWVLDATGAANGLHQVTSGDHTDYRPAWSPDGGTIYFSSGRSGTAQIWKVTVPSVAAERQSWGSLKGAFR
jgi:Tol biopolymer transport system component